MNRFVLLDGKPVVVYPTENQTIPSSYPYFQPPYNYLLGSVFTLLSIWSVLGNLLVLLIVTRYKRMRTRTNILLANLATIDLMTGLLAVPFSAITAFNGGWVLGETACQVNGFLNALFAAASIHSLMYISIHKYWSTKNIFSDGSPVRRIIVMISAAWIWGLLFGTALVTGWTRIEYKTGTTQCGPKNPERGNAREVSHSILTSSTNFLIPLLVILYCYTAVFRIFRRSVSRLVEQDYWQSLSEKHLLARQRKIAITLIIIFVAFLLCLAPYIAYSTTIALFKDKTRVPSVFNPVAYIFLYLSSCINPVIYAFRSRELSAAYQKILRMLCCDASQLCKTSFSSSRTGKPTGGLPAGAGMRRRSLEAVRCLARKTQKIQRLQFEYQYQPSRSGSGSFNTQPSSTVSCFTTRTPRRRSLSLWSTHGNSRQSKLPPTSQSLYFIQEGNALFAPYRPLSTLERGRGVKSTIVEEKTSQIEPDNRPADIKSDTINFGGSIMESQEDRNLEEISLVHYSA